MALPTDLDTSLRHLMDGFQPPTYVSLTAAEAAIELQRLRGLNVSLLDALYLIEQNADGSPLGQVLGKIASSAITKALEGSK